MKLSIAVLALICAIPAAAQDTAAVAGTDYASLSDDELRQQLAANANELLSRPCDNVPLFAELRRRNPEAVPFARGHIVVQGFCAAEQDAYADGLELVREAERDFATDGLDMLALYFATRLEDASEALGRLRALALSGDLARVPRENVFPAIRAIRSGGIEDEFDELGSEVVGLAVFSRLEPNVRSSFAVAALRHTVKAGDLTPVESLLAEVRSPSVYVDLLASRDYEPAWPAIERHAGDHLANVSEGHVAWAAEWLADKPEDADRLSEYAHALLFAGRFEEAVAVTRNWLGKKGGGDEVQEGDGWALNIEAYALDRLGRREEADRVFDDLATLPADEHPWVVNFVINRASRLVGQERWEEGLQATVLARSVAEEYGSMYAKMLIARDRACALHRLGRTDEAETEVEFLVANFDEAGHVATTGLLCTGREDRAEDLIAKALAEDLAKAALISDMQDDRFDLFYTASELPRARDLILARDALRDLALAEIRLLPERLVPVANLERSFASTERDP